MVELKEPRREIEESAGPTMPPAPRRTLRQASGAILPTLATLGNLICGFGAIYCAARGASEGVEDFIYAEITYFTVGGWLIFLSMVFDALDGRLARMTRSTSDLGAQLDSLADVVSFGAAPAFLMLMMVGHYVASDWLNDHWLVGTDRGARVAVRGVWVIGAVFVSCAALRLARFNVETSEDEAAHIWFKGLPSPGAAAAIASLALLMEWFVSHFGDGSSGWSVRLVFWALPVITLAAGLMMVSNVPYPHAVNRFMRGRHPFRNLVGVVLLVALVILSRHITLAVASVGYALAGPAMYVYRRAVRKDRRTADELAAALIGDDEAEE